MSKALLTRLVLLAAGTLTWSACTVHKTEAPPVSGPSEFALSFGVSASPDAISQDGGSQASIAVRAFDANGAPRPSVTFRLDMRVAGQAVDYGTLSGKTVVTGADGRAAAVYTAPPAAPAGTNLPSCAASAFSPALPGGCVQIVATPVGTGFSSAVSQSVDIHLIPLGVILPPAATPTAQFTFTPTTPSANSPVQFDASASCAGQTDAGGACPASSGPVASYAWEFGDGGTATGRLASHAYASSQSYSVTLTVANDRGVKASTTKQVSVGAGSAPTAAFVFSPTPVTVGAEVFFDASNSRPGLGHTIATYKWNWGDGDPTVSLNSPLQDHDFTAVGTYTVLLTVTDESGQQGTTTQTVSVASGNPTPSFVTAVTGAATHTIQVDGSASTSVGTSTLATYTWSWGDGSPGSAGVIQTHAYGGAGTYTVKLTVTDSLGRTASSSSSAIVP